jgi:hypothetical protein
VKTLRQTLRNWGYQYTVATVVVVIVAFTLLIAWALVAAVVRHRATDALPADAGTLYTAPFIPTAHGEPVSVHTAYPLCPSGGNIVTIHDDLGRCWVWCGNHWGTVGPIRLDRGDYERLLGGVLPAGDGGYTYPQLSVYSSWHELMLTCARTSERKCP